ncbi:unnamed protein product [Calicophoron daubneyi]|uniref:alpha-1,2-Mannosidase n=1 Tax=Calicophoron daubneyi TaxID=300641 RepID=A0AAV2T1G9_CALDB
MRINTLPGFKLFHLRNPRSHGRNFRLLNVYKFFAVFCFLSSSVSVIMLISWNIPSNDSGTAVDSSTTESPDPYLNVASEIRNAVVHSWEAYKESAWGLDELHPISRTGTVWMGTAVTMIDSLDTLWIMGLFEEFKAAQNWTTKNLRFNLDSDHINLFEITIRVLGGLLSAHSLSKEKIFLKKAEELGSRLLCAFTPNMILPKTDINLARQTSHYATWTTSQSLSEVSSIQLELNELTALTGNVVYASVGAKISKHLHSISKTKGLINCMLDTSTGLPEKSSAITMGARADSYYEYLLKVWVQNGRTIDFLLRDFTAAIEGVAELLVGYSKPNNLMFIAEAYTEGQTIPKMDHLVCYLPGALAYAVHHGLPEKYMQMATELMRTCYEMYRQMPTGLSPDYVYFSEKPDSEGDMTVMSDGRFNALRPETMESLYYLYRMTRNQTYREWGERIFRAFQNYSRVPSGGYAVLHDVTDVHSPHVDIMHSFWISETLKYAFLLFNETAASLFPFDKWVFNTEGHPLPVHSKPHPLVLDSYG